MAAIEENAVECPLAPCLARLSSSLYAADGQGDSSESREMYTRGTCCVGVFAFDDRGGVTGATLLLSTRRQCRYGGHRPTSRWSGRRDPNNRRQVATISLLKLSTARRDAVR